MEMYGFDRQESIAFILSHMDQKPFKKILPQLPTYLSELTDADFSYMLDADVLDEEGYQSDGEYDEDEAFEWIYRAFLENHPEFGDDDLMIAQLVDSYRLWQDSYLQDAGLAEE